MARIKKVSFASVGRMEGCTCERCGQYIQNIYTVDFSDGVRMNFGIDCFSKLCRTGKLSDFGKKLMKKALKNIVWAEEGLAKEKLLTEETDEGYKRTQEKHDWESPSYWYGRPWEEYHDWMINSWWPKRFEENQKEIDRFSEVEFNRE